MAVAMATVTVDMSAIFTDAECKAARGAMTYQAKKWRASIRSMRRDGRHDEADALEERLAVLDQARSKLGSEVPTEDEETSS